MKYVMTIDGTPVAWGEDKQILEQCAEGTRENDLEIRGEKREILVFQLTPRHPVCKMILRAQRHANQGNWDKAIQALGWRKDD